MKNFALVNVLALFVASFAFSSALIDPSLRAFAQGESVGTARVLILVKNQPVSGRPQRYDRPNVIRYYKEAARLSVLPLLTSYQNKQLQGVRLINVFWINGAVLADVTPEGLKVLAAQDSVTKIYKNNKVGLEPGLNLRLAGRGSPLDEVAADYAFPSIGLDRLAKEQPNLNGQGVIVGIEDTGVDASHSALEGKVPLFFDGVSKTTTPPKDYDQHGTHVSGTIAGGDRLKNNIGIAPAAKIVMAGVVMQGYDAMLAGMQWFLDAEKNPIVANKIRAVGCSWNTGGAPDQEVFYRAIAAWEAAGILPVFSAGNAGKNGITHPHEYPGTLAVAAYGANGLVAPFSSRGPGHYKGQDTNKPDIAAPGVDIYSSLPGAKYGKMSGTSMAQPHVTGATALLLQVNPNLNPAQIREILVKSSVPGQGQSQGQWSPEYGFGKLNIYNAVKLLATVQTPGFSYLLRSMKLDPGSQMDEQSFEYATLGEVDGEVDHYDDTDPAQWLTASEAFRN